MPNHDGHISHRGRSFRGDGGLAGHGEEGTVDIVDAALLTRDLDGEVKVQQKSLPSVKKWTGRGAIIGAAIGLIFPPSLLGGALVGAGVGAGSAARRRAVLKSDDLWDAAKELEPGTSAFAAVVEDEWVDQIQKAAQGHSRLAEQTLDADVALISASWLKRSEADPRHKGV